MEGKKIIIIGGGLAGLTCAIHLRKSGFAVRLLEKTEYPQHKVCGEYISNEVLPYLKWLDADPEVLHPTSISKLTFSSPTGKEINCNLPLGGFGISRYTLDHFLFRKALEIGCIISIDAVTSVKYADNEFSVQTSQNGSLKADLVIAAYGKRSILDQKLKRNFISKKSPWLAVKGHYRGHFPEDLVGLHNFKGGYCGVSKVEEGRINICYLTDYKSFKTFKDINEFQQKVLCKNPHLKQIFENCKPLFEQPLTISQVSFENKEPVCDHILMIGDTAGLIHPLCGNGMAMAMDSARICAILIEKYLNTDIISRSELERLYTKHWNHHFRSRLRMGRILSYIFRKEKLFKPLLNLLVKFPSLLPIIIKRTHGEPITECL